MKIRRKTELRVVRDEEELMINKLLTELQDEDMSKELGEQQENKKQLQKRRIFAAGIVGVVTAALAAFLYLPTYTSGTVVTSYHAEKASNNGYEQFSDGVLKYSRDGIAYLDKKSKEIWNHAYQIKNPFIEVYEKTAVVADKGGNTIIVFDEKGVKGNIQTSLPIEKVAVSEQGIVSALLKNENAPKIVCYDTAGNMLVELKTSFTGTGYPMDVSISSDGTLLLVPYMCVENGKVITRIVYYSFAGETSVNKEFEVVKDSYEGMIAPTAFFVDDSISVVVGDDRLLLYKGKSNPTLFQTIMLEKEIKSVFHNDKYVGLVLKNEGKAGYELCLYNTSGKKVMSEEFTGDYTNAKIEKGQVLMYDGKKCCIFTRLGIHRFNGEINSNILEIFPVTGINKYIVMSENGMEIIRLSR